MNFEDLLEGALEFEWDSGNIDKNWKSHLVHDEEAEEIFSNEPKMLGIDKKHSEIEERYYCLGVTHQNRKLFVSFTLRKYKVRIISARDMSKKERRIYEEKSKTTPTF